MKMVVKNVLGVLAGTALYFVLLIIFVVVLAFLKSVPVLEAILSISLTSNAVTTLPIIFSASLSASLCEIICGTSRWFFAVFAAYYAISLIVIIVAGDFSNPGFSIDIFCILAGIGLCLYNKT